MRPAIEREREARSGSLGAKKCGTGSPVPHFLLWLIIRVVLPAVQHRIQIDSITGNGKDYFIPFTEQGLSIGSVRQVVIRFCRELKWILLQCVKHFCKFSSHPLCRRHTNLGQKSGMTYQHFVGPPGYDDRIFTHRPRPPQWLAPYPAGRPARCGLCNRSDGLTVPPTDRHRQRCWSPATKTTAPTSPLQFVSTAW